MTVESTQSSALNQTDARIGIVLDGVHTSIAHPGLFSPSKLNGYLVGKHIKYKDHGEHYGDKNVGKETDVWAMISNQITTRFSEQKSSFMKMLMLVPVLLLSMNLFAGDSHPHGTIALTVDHFQDNSGVALIFLFSSSNGFPDQSAKAVKTLEAKIRKGKLDASFMDIPYGVYAVSVLHDENRNGRMDTNWLGMPKEGYGASNDAKSSFGPPKFDEASFSLNTDELQLHIKVRY